jgi:hypothetical protein
MSFVKTYEIRPLIAGTQEYDERILRFTTGSWIYRIFKTEGLVDPSFSAILYPDKNTIDIIGTEFDGSKTVKLNNQRLDRL